MGYIETVVYKRPSSIMKRKIRILKCTYNKHVMYMFVILFVIIISLCILPLLMIEINYFLTETFY